MITTKEAVIDLLVAVVLPLVIMLVVTISRHEDMRAAGPRGWLNLVRYGYWLPRIEITVSPDEDGPSFTMQGFNVRTMKRVARGLHVKPLGNGWVMRMPADVQRFIVRVHPSVAVV